MGSVGESPWGLAVGIPDSPEGVSNLLERPEGMAGAMGVSCQRNWVSPSKGVTIRRLEDFKGGCIAR